MNDGGTILIIEDEEHDVDFLRRAFRRAGVPNPIQVVENGEQTIAYLTGRGEFADRKKYPYPRVIVTDLKMPQMSGLELLRWVRSNPKYRIVPTIVLTSSTSQADVDLAFACGASAYFVKPVAFADLEKVAKLIWEYWSFSRLPTPTE
jgi:CheY-like chemotaxis protein